MRRIMAALLLATIYGCIVYAVERSFSRILFLVPQILVVFVLYELSIVGVNAVVAALA